MYAISSAAYQQAQGSADAAQNNAGGAETQGETNTSSNDEDVIDAEYTKQ